MNKSDLFKKLQNLDPADAKKLNLTEEEVKYLKDKVLNDKLGLVLNFSEKDEELKSNYILLDEVKELAINPKDKNNNLLIEGDNYHALKALQKANVKVDAIYIDPPYNTGYEFVYRDDFGAEKVVGQDDPHKHSKWLSFIKKRLELAHDLLSEEGVIFVSIDDNEQAYLRVLMDEIFGENNFLTTFIWERTHHSNKNNSGKKVFRNVDYLHCFARNENSLKFLTEGLQTEFGDAPLFNKANNEKTLVFPKGKVFLKKQNKFNDCDLIITFRCRWSQNKINEEIEAGTTFIIKGDNNESIRAIYHNDKEGYIIPNQLLNTSDYFVNVLGLPTTERGTSQLQKIMGGNVFDYPKPSDLVKYLLKLLNNKTLVVMDFFAGSGTTGQAVMELNAEDGGNRRFILVTNNEMSGVDTVANPEKGIARAITRERLFRVINEKGSNGETISWKAEKSLKNNSVKYLKVKLLDKIDGEFEEIDNVKKLYEDEFDKSISIVDFKE